MIMMIKVIYYVGEIRRQKEKIINLLGILGLEMRYFFWINVSLSYLVFFFYRLDDVLQDFKVVQYGMVVLRKSLGFC